MPDEALGVRQGQAAEAVWKYLVSNAGAEPRRRMALPVDGQLPGVRPPVGAVAGLIQHAAGAVLPPQAEAVPDQLRRRRRRQDAGKAHPVAGGALQRQLQLPDLAGELVKKHQGAVGEALRGQRAAAEGDRRAAGHGAEGVLAGITAGIKDKRFTHGMRLSPYGSSWFSPVTALPLSSAAK